MLVAPRYIAALVQLLILVQAFAGTGCRKSAPTSPGGALSGTWTGTVVDSAAGTGSASLVMVQSAAGVSGTWSVAFASGVAAGGTLGGSVSGSAVSLFLTPTTPIACPSGGSLSGTLSVTAALAVNRLTGSYVILTCTGATSGTLDVTK